MVNFINLFNKLFKKKEDYKNLIIVNDLEDIDFNKEILSKNFVMIGEEKRKWLYFKCPCGCKNVIQLNLMKSYFPRWRITANRDKTINIYPSIINTKCDSHFWINSSRVVWHKE